MIWFKHTLIFICLFILVSCQPKKEEPADVGLGNLSSSEFTGPVLSSQDLEVEYGSSVAMDLTASNEDTTFSYTISRQPMYGTLTGTPPAVTYTPYAGFLGYDRFYFSVTNSRGQWAQATISFHVVPSSRTIFLRNTGSDATGVVDNPLRPYLTVQKAVDVALSLSPSQTNPVIIDVGEGTFGDVTLTEDFGEHVSWTVSDLVYPVIGNITATGSTGDDDEDGGRGWEITIDADSMITFGTITSQGGSAGAAVNRSTYGGKPGAIIIKGIVGNLYSIPGSGQRKSDGACIGQNAGNVIVEEDAEASNIVAEGYPCDVAGNGGNIIINGAITGSIYASGGSSAVGGTGGNVWVKGSVAGSVYAYGGTGDSGGNGGIVSVEGTIAGDIEASGGVGAATTGGTGGTIEVQIGAEIRDLNVSGGDGATKGGQGGEVTVLYAAVRNINANGGATSFAGGGAVNIGGAGGAITLDGYGYAGILSVLGGGCNNSEGGAGGNLFIHSTAVYNSADSSEEGGSCSGGGTDGTDGSVTSF